MSKIDIDKFVEHLMKWRALDIDAVESALHEQGLTCRDYKIQKITPTEKSKELEVKEMDLKLNKLYKQGWKDAVAKASIFVYQLATALPNTSYTDADNMTGSFKKYMEEEQ